jgi:hypothetical protein
VGRGDVAGDRVPAGGVLGSRFAWRVGGVGYLSLKQFHSSRKGGDCLGRTTPHRIGTVLVGCVRTVGYAVRVGVMLAQNVVERLHESE